MGVRPDLSDALDRTGQEQGSNYGRSSHIETIQSLPLEI